MRPSFPLLRACLALMITLGALRCAAQVRDTLVYTNGQVITGKVLEIGIDQVKFRTGNDEGVIITTAKSEFARIRLGSGERFDLNAPTRGTASPEFMARKGIISMDVISPALNHLTIGYERSVGDRIAFCVRAGYIGLGDYARINDRVNYKGGLVKLGVKFVLPQGRRRMPHIYDTHPLSGWYLKPELIFSYWTSDRFYNYPYYDPLYYPYPYPFTEEYKSAAVNVVVGRQVMLGERVSFDFYGGLGYGLQWRNGQQTNAPDNYYYSDRQEYSFSHIFLGNYTPLVISGGMTFGLLF